MAHSFIAYIDESGDDGLKRIRSTSHSGGTQWLTISCCVARYVNDLEFVSWRDQIKVGGKREIHFRELNHSQKLMACQKIATFPVRGITILSNKTLIPEGTYNQKNQLYHYLTRYLIERLSWLCRDMRPKVPEGDGRVKIIFSKRGGMNYEDFRNYLRKLQASESEIHWPVVDIDAVDARDHSTRAGLQIADCIASAFRMAVDPDEYGNCEPRYAKELKANTYNRNSNYLSYCMKVLPTIDRIESNPDRADFFSHFCETKEK